jgi:hypothetical protein
VSYKDYEEWWTEYRRTEAPRDKGLRVAITRAPITVLKTCDPVDADCACIGKPKGFWYSFGTEWLDWCLEEGGVGFLGNYVYAINVNPKKLLALTTTADVYNFSKKHYTPIDSNFPDFARVIKWGDVAAEYSGIEINPYHWEARLDPKTFWYYSWDVASGCIWEPSPVVGFELLAECPIPKPKRRMRNGNEEVQRECGS